MTRESHFEVRTISSSFSRSFLRNFSLALSLVCSTAQDLWCERQRERERLWRRSRRLCMHYMHNASFHLSSLPLLRLFRSFFASFSLLLCSPPPLLQPHRTPRVCINSISCLFITQLVVTVTHTLTRTQSLLRRPSRPCVAACAAACAADRAPHSRDASRRSRGRRNTDGLPDTHIFQEEKNDDLTKRLEGILKSSPTQQARCFCHRFCSRLPPVTLVNRGSWWLRFDCQTQAGERKMEEGCV